jgi:hypothetical protein
LSLAPYDDFGALLREAADHPSRGDEPNVH